MAEEVPEGKFTHEYVVIGCGGTGFSVVRELVRRGKNVLAVDISKERVEILRDENYDAIVGDARDESLYHNLDFDRVSVIMLLTSDVEVNRSAIEIIRKFSKDVFVIARAPSSKLKEDLEHAGADFVVVPSEAMKNSVVDAIKKIDTFRKIKKFKKILESVKGGKLGIFTHDNPDPDAISSAFALKEIAKRFGIEADIIYYGEILHQENRAMVNLLEIPLLRGDEVDLSKYKKFALVDCSAPGVNNSIPRDI